MKTDAKTTDIVHHPPPPLMRERGNDEFSVAFDDTQSYADAWPGPHMARKYHPLWFPLTSPHQSVQAKLRLCSTLFRRRCLVRSSTFFAPFPSFYPRLTSLHFILPYPAFKLRAVLFFAVCFNELFLSTLYNVFLDSKSV
jgi:hypothetical protein